MNDRRSWGTGTVTTHRGEIVARLPAEYGRKVLGKFGTREEAESVLAAALAQLAQTARAEPTLVTHGRDLLERRPVRAGTMARNILAFEAYLVDRDGRGVCSLASIPLTDITRDDVEDWLRGLRGKRRAQLAPQTRDNALNLLRGILDQATKRGRPLHGRPNPAEGVTLGRRAHARSDDPWTWLQQDEIDLIERAEGPSLKSKAYWLTGIYTGLRDGELCGLRVENIAFRRGVITVCWSRGEPPKSGKPREVPMIPPARAWLERWLSERDDVDNPLGLVFAPELRRGSTGPQWHASGYDAQWAKWWPRIGGRHVRSHDHRHTCASQLLDGEAWVERGWITEPLRIEDVCKWMGHSSIEVTQRYAHLSTRSIHRKVGAASGYKIGYENSGSLSHLGDLNPGPTVYEGVTAAPNSPMFSDSSREDNPDVSNIVSSLERAAALVSLAVARGESVDGPALALVELAAQLPTLAPLAAQVATLIARRDEYATVRALDLVDAVIERATGAVRRVGGE